MKLVRLEIESTVVPVVLEQDGRARDVRHLTSDFTPSFLAQGGLETLRGTISDAPQLSPDVAQRARALSPISATPTIVTIATNYYSHAEEAGRPVPSEPVVVLKAGSSLSGPTDDIYLPKGGQRLDWEVELGLIIGHSYWGPEDGPVMPHHIAGYILANDLAERDLQLERPGKQWSLGKSYPTFCPAGPILATPDELDLENLELSCWVNGELRQRAGTSDMIFDVEAILNHVGRNMRLLPGDLVLTGTPGGVALTSEFPYLKVGDVLESEITGLGQQRCHVTQGPAARLDH